MPISVEELNRSQGVPMKEVFSKVGITKRELAKAAKEALGASITRTVKLKGWFDKRKKLPKGYKIIKGTADETIIEHLVADNGVRTRAWMEVCRQMGLYPSESVSVQHSFDSLVGEVVRDILKTSKGVPPLPSMEKSE